MRLDILDSDETRVVGAIVVAKTRDNSDITIDAGPADGLPLVRLTLTRTQALQLSANLRAVANGGDEEVLLGEE